ncbi:unnamed protein product [Brassica rapa subsp. trilocularis]
MENFILLLCFWKRQVPLGVFREHTINFSTSWFVAVHAAVPFILKLKKSVLKQPWL